ncbi:saccharopine dehydrogenase NADP-binding domain-containing protein [candidate division KSB1 bacterium]|nr:saccharopine dehydrogenase NADP-binding domain-containing protein [candidate division KSB1 bacterium]
MNNILVLGTGSSVKMFCHQILDVTDATIKIIDPAAESIVKHFDKNRVLAHKIDPNNLQRLESFISDADIVVVPKTLENLSALAQLCIRYRVHLVTQERVNRDIVKWNDEVVKNGLLFLFEVGLNPGIDHISAMTLLETIRQREAKILSFESYLGDMPAPEANDNPFGFKFVENPDSVLKKFKNPVFFRSQNQEIKLAEKNAFERYWLKDIESLGHMEVFPYENSLFYQDFYHLPEAETFILGVFRNPGWCESMDKIVKMGYMSNKKIPGPMSMIELTALLIRRKTTGHFIRKLANFLNISPTSVILKRLEWLGLLSEDPIPSGCGTPFQVLSAKMNEKMVYQDYERDLVLLFQEVIVEYPDLKHEKFSVTLAQYGNPGKGMASTRLNGLLLSLAVQLVLKNKSRLTGVRLPVVADIYRPIMQGLDDHKVQFRRKIFRDV